MKLRWVADLPREISSPEYPRPQLVRELGKSLNGSWGYAITGAPGAMRGVPSATGSGRQTDGESRTLHRAAFGAGCDACFPEVPPL